MIFTYPLFIQCVSLPLCIVDISNEKMMFHEPNNSYSMEDIITKHKRLYRESTLCVLRKCQPLNSYVCCFQKAILSSLSPGRRQAIFWTNIILSIWTLGRNSNEILSEIRVFSFKKMHLKMSSANWRPFCLGLSVLIRDHHYEDKLRIAWCIWLIRKSRNYVYGI